MSFKDFKQIIVNYHYVEDPRETLRGIHPLSVEDFNKQIDFLSNNFDIVSVPEVYRMANENSNKRVCAITFDDCLKDQWDNALPILEKNNVLATFFPITSTFEGYVPTAHKIQVLLSSFDIKDLINKFNNFIKDNYPNFINKYYISQDKRLINRRLHEDIPTANLKEVFSILPSDVRSVFLEESFRYLNVKEFNICSQIFMSRDQVLSLHKKGHTIGGHTHKHNALDSLDISNVRTDTYICRDRLVDIIGSKPNVFSYPHGRYNDSVLGVIKEAGFTHGVTIEKRGLNRSENSMTIPRFDATDIVV